MDRLHGPEEVPPGPQHPQHLRHVQGVDGVTGEPPGGDDDVIGLLPQSGGEDPVHIAADVVPVQTEGLQSPQGGKVAVQSIDIDVTCKHKHKVSLSAVQTGPLDI